MNCVRNFIDLKVKVKLWSWW